MTDSHDPNQLDSLNQQPPRYPHPTTTMPVGYPYIPTHPPQAYAFWGRRIMATLADAVFYLPFGVVALVTNASIQRAPVSTKYIYDVEGSLVSMKSTGGEIISNPPAYMIALFVTSFMITFAFGVWNQIIRQGATGSSLGKQLLYIKVVSETDGLPIGPGKTFIRLLAHFLDYVPCNVGYLWPLWDPKRQTFADKIMSTVVVSTVPGQAPPIGRRHQQPPQVVPPQSGPPH